MPSPAHAARLAALASLLLVAACAGGAEHTVCRADLPLLEHKSHLIVPALINGHSVPALLDTGAQGSSVTEATITRLELQSDPRHGTIISGVGGQGVLQNDALIERFELAGYASGLVHYSVLQLSLDSPGKEPIGALVGDDLLSHFDIDLDVAHRKLALYDPDKCQDTQPDWQASALQVPLSTSFGTGRLTLKVKVNGHELNALLDSGSEGTVLDLAAAERIGVSREVLSKEPGGTGFGAAGVNFRMVAHKFESLEVAGDRFDGPTLAVLDRDLREADIILGLDWLRKHHVLISFRRNILYVARPTGAG
jgi:predicted aspartyl protease